MSPPSHGGNGAAPPSPPSRDDEGGDGRDLSALCAALRHASPETRLQAAARIGQLGTNARDAKLHLINACTDPHALVRQWSVWALGRLHLDDVDIRQCLMRCASDEDDEVVKMSFRALAELSPNEDCVDELVSWPYDARESAAVRIDFVKLIAHYAAKHDAALGFLVQLAVDDPSLDAHARGALEKIAQSQPARVHHYLVTGDVQARTMLLGILSETNADGIKPQLLRCAADDDSDVRAMAATGLARTSFDTASRAALLNCLVDHEPRVRTATCAALRTPALQHASIRRSIIMLLQDPNAAVRQEATLTLGKIVVACGIEEITQTVPVLAKNIAGEDHRLACFSAWVLEKMGRAAYEAIPALEIGAKSEDPLLRKSAAAALDKLQASGDENGEDGDHPGNGSETTQPVVD